MNEKSNHVSLHDQIKCPFCDGEVNSLTFISLSENYAVFLVECWSGDCHKPSNYHQFLAKVKLPSEMIVIENQEKVKSGES